MLTAIILLLKLPVVAGRDIVGFAVLSLVSLLLLTAIHIFVAGLGVITTEVDHTIWVFRNLSGLAQAPVDIYSEGLRTVLTFVIPVGLIFTFPAKTLYGLLNPAAIGWAIAFAVVFYVLALKFWHYSLKLYSSASS